MSGKEERSAILWGYHRLQLMKTSRNVCPTGVKTAPLNVVCERVEKHNLSWRIQAVERCIKLHNFFLNVRTKSLDKYRIQPMMWAKVGQSGG
jgi:hypothetical protein